MQSQDNNNNNHGLDISSSSSSSLQQPSPLAMRIPSSQHVFTAITYPGFVNHNSKSAVNKVIHTLGGPEMLACGLAGGQAIVLRNQKGDVGIRASGDEKPRFLLRIRRQKRVDGSNKQRIIGEVIGVVSREFRFNESTPPLLCGNAWGSPTFDDIQCKRWSDDAAVVNIQRDVMMRDDISNLPMHFAPFPVALKPPSRKVIQSFNASSLEQEQALLLGRPRLSTKKPSSGNTNPHDSRRRFYGNLFQSIDAGAAIPQAPIKGTSPEQAVMTLPIHMRDDILEKVRSMFEERPIWTWTAVCSRLRLDRQTTEKIVGATVGYYMRSGPWMRCFVRYKYDPFHRVNAHEAWRYQVVGYAVPRLIESIVHFSDSHIVRLDRSTPDLEWRWDPNKVPSRALSFYSLCDLSDNHCHAIVYSIQDEDLSDVATEKMGWIRPDSTRIDAIEARMDECMVNLVFSLSGHIDDTVNTGVAETFSNFMDRLHLYRKRRFISRAQRQRQKIKNTAGSTADSTAQGEEDKLEEDDEHGNESDNENREISAGVQLASRQTEDVLKEMETADVFNLLDSSSGESGSDTNDSDDSDEVI